jgi:hypothetical protein
MNLNCQRCGREYALPANYQMLDSLAIEVAYCAPCASATNARFLAIYGAKN